MQDDDNRPSKNVSIVWLIKPANAVVKAELQRVVSKALILNPVMSDFELAEALARETCENLNKTPFSVMLRAVYQSIIQKARKAEAARNDGQQCLPGFEHIPSMIPTREGKTISLIDASYRRLRDYYRELARSHKRKLQADPKLLEVKALMGRMRKYTGRDRGITVRQVLLLDAASSQFQRSA